tara:strand:- start:114 stop:542 length:429 start_codon:yes stop_codon:yes gene_type:complete
MFSYTTAEGFVLTVHTGGAYMDYGLEISHPLCSGINGELFYSPHALSNESYGVSAPEGAEWEDVESGDVEGVPWGEAEWIECLKNEQNELLEAFVNFDTLAALDPTDAAGNPRGDDDPQGWCVSCECPAGDCSGDVEGAPWG